MVASRSTEFKEDRGMAAVLERDFAATKEQDGDQQHGKNPLTQSHPMSLNLLQLRRSNAPPQIASVKLQLLQSCNARRHAVQQGSVIV